MPSVFRYSIPGRSFDPRVNAQQAKGSHTGWRWDRFRRRWLAAHPLCQDCGRLAECVHHIEPRCTAPERMYDPTNLASLCVGCHEERHRSGRLGR